jgi:hypothetical protein
MNPKQNKWESRQTEYIVYIATIADRTTQN